jgi:hypothetical protein
MKPGPATDSAKFVKLAVTDVLPAMVNVHVVPAVVHAGGAVQPTNAKPVSAVAVRVTCVPGLKPALHPDVAPARQLICPVASVTVPAPVTETLNVCGGPKVAVTVCGVVFCAVNKQSPAVFTVQLVHATTSLVGMMVGCSVTCWPTSTCIGVEHGAWVEHTVAKPGWIDAWTVPLSPASVSVSGATPTDGMVPLADTGVPGTVKVQKPAELHGDGLIPLIVHVAKTSCGSSRICCPAGIVVVHS